MPKMPGCLTTAQTTMQTLKIERNALIQLSLELAKELAKLCPDPIHKNQVKDLEAELARSGAEPRTSNHRFQTWAGTTSMGVLERLLGIPETEEPLTVWPIVDHETCGPINGFPRLDQWCAVAFSSEMQNTVARALEKHYAESNPLGAKRDYEDDLALAKATCETNPSTKNQEDVLAAENALKRHYPQS